MKNILLVAIGGMVGSVLRYLATIAIKPFNFPMATFSVNIIGSLLIGAIMGWSMKQPQAEFWRLLLATGICGGFTTFSAFAWENLQLLNQQRYLHFCMYAGGSLILSLVTVAIGYSITK
jgi:fluoride exporter